MSRMCFFNWEEHYRDLALYAKQQELYSAFKDWDGLPRINDDFTLPWSAYTRHNWHELYTHFLYYPFRTFKEFAQTYGLNYKSSQTWINQRILPGKLWGINGGWRWEKAHWFRQIIEDNDIEAIEMLYNPDVHVLKYRPISTLPART